MEEEKELIQNAAFVATTVSKAVVDKAVYMQKSDIGSVKLHQLSAGMRIRKIGSNCKGEGKLGKSFAEESSVVIPAKEILLHSYKLVAATSVDNARFDDTYIDIINSAKIDIT